MPHETQVTLVLDSASLFQALAQQQPEWRLADHDFDPDTDEVKISYDIGGSGRVALTVAFELTEAGMAELLRTARPADA